MIANRGWKRFDGKSSFADAIRYIVREGDRKKTQEPPLAVWVSNVSSVENAPLEMAGTASLSKAEDPLYHLVISWADDEQPTAEEAKAALDTQIEHLGFVGLQYVASLQNDGKTQHYHVHAIFNRVDPQANTARPIWKDHERMRDACRETELEQGWQTGDLQPGQGPGLSGEARNAEYHFKKKSFERRVREDIAPALRVALSEHPSWETLHRVCREYDARYEEVTRKGEVIGGRLCGKEVGEYARARELGEEMTHIKLVARLGSFERDQQIERATFQERCVAAAQEVDSLRTGGADWRQVHAVFARHGIEYQRYRTGARFANLDSPETLRTKDVGRDFSLSGMEHSFGPFETSHEIEQREQARDALRSAENLGIGAQLIANPQLLLDRLTATSATFQLRDIQRVVRQKVLDFDQQHELVKAIVASSVELSDNHGRVRYTTQAVLDLEHAAFSYAKELAASANVKVTRAAPEHLSEQQREAYGYATHEQGRLKCVTGVPGAGKTTLISEIASAYRAAGSIVRAVSVANAAVDVLRRETDVPAESVAKQLHEWAQEKALLQSGDVLIVDEVSTLGTAQGALLLKAVLAQGATLIALGDHKQFESVAHGSALRILQNVLGAATVDMEQTYRQQSEWQRDATHAVRRGDIREAVMAYHERGLVHQSVTQDQARAALIERWQAIEESGVECGIEAYTNTERIALNLLAREAWKAMGQLHGQDVELETQDGKMLYAIGERVVIREAIRPAGLFNGSVGIVRGIHGAVLEIERRDGVLVDVDTFEYSGIQHAYCTTEWREQGSTRHAELQMITEHVNQRSLTVGMTRHEHTFEMFYSEELVGDIEKLISLGERSQSKELASEYELVPTYRNLLNELTRHNATFQERDIAKLLEHVKEQDEVTRNGLRVEILAASIPLIAEDGSTRFTTQAILDMEKAAYTAVRGLYAATVEPIARDAAARLFTQQREAYTYALQEQSRLKLITGVPGAGKTTLIFEIAAAYREAGYSVRAVAVANSAVDVMRREGLDFPVQSVAKQLHEWDLEHELMTDRDVLFIDEVSTLGTEQGARLLQAVHERGAIVIALGDHKQFESVAHGSALRIMQNVLDTHMVDMQTTGRQKLEWQREATHAVRRGEIKAAIEAYQHRGLVHEYVAQADARRALIDRWKQIEASGIECGIETYTNAERVFLNEIAREAWRELGRLEGRDVLLTTQDGHLPYAVGDRVVIREPIKSAGLFNGAVGIIQAIDGTAVKIERPDKSIAEFETRDYPNIQHAYCTTEWREQGSTRFAELQLLTKQVNQRSLTVGMTRHRESFEMFYAQEEVGDLEKLVELGGRSQAKDLASNYSVINSEIFMEQGHEIEIDHGLHL